MRPTDANRKWWILAAMTGAMSMIMLDSTVVGVALPSMQRDLDMSQTGAQWVFNAYLLTVATTVAVGGRLAGMFNRTTVLYAGITLFLIGSVNAGFAASSGWLVVARAVQGLGAALMVPSAQSLVVDSFPPERRGRAMGVFIGVSTVSLSLGPLIGGFFTETMSWRWIFFINVPIGVATVMGARIADPPKDRETGKRFDFLGCITLVGGMAGVVLGLMQSTVWGWSSVKTVGCLVAGACLLALFVAIELRQSSPIVQLRLFANRNFAGDMVAASFAQAALVTMTVFGAIYVQDLLGYTPIEAGVSLLAMTIPVFIIAPIAGRTYDRFGPRFVVPPGALMIGIGFVWCAVMLEKFSFPHLIPGYVAIGIGIPMMMGPANTDAMNAAGRSLRADASGVMLTMRQVGGTVGLAVLGTIVAFTQKADLERVIGSPNGVPPETADITRMLAETETDRAAILSHFPSSRSEDILIGARDAIAHGIEAAYLICGVALAVAAVIAFSLLRRVRYED